MSKRKKNRKASQERRQNKPQKVQDSAIVTEASTPKGFRAMFSEEGLFRLTYFWPFFAGALIFDKMLLVDIVLFSLNLIVIFAVYQCSLVIQERKNTGHKSIYSGLYYGLMLLAIFLYYGQTKSLSLAGILVAYSLATLLRGLIGCRNPSRVIWSSLLVCFEVTLLPVMGLASQTKELTLDYLQVAILGLIPGLLLSSYLVASNSLLLKNFGWQKSAVITNKKGKEIIRPRGIARLYSIFMMLGPVVPATLLIFNRGPQSFWLYLLPVFFMPQLASDFLNETKSDEEITRKTLKLAAMVSLMGLLVGLFA